MTDNKIIIIPAAGSSTRFGSVNRPKWLLTNPNGKLMIEDCISNLTHSKSNLILIGVLEEHIDKYCNGNVDFFKKLFNEIEINVIPIVLSDKTKSQPETIYKTIEKFNELIKYSDSEILQNPKISDHFINYNELLKGSIFIKDCDNCFKHNVSFDKNYICYVNLSENKEITNVSGKSFVELNNVSEITNIVEKRVISNNICVSGYSLSVDLFIKIYEEIINSEYYNKIIELGSELYMSHLIYQMMLKGHIFFGEKVQMYQDWGTYNEWIKYKSEFKTLFIDFDGTLVVNTNPYFGNNMTDKCTPIIENVHKIQQLRNTGKYYIIITTSRPEWLKDITINQLNNFNIPYDKLIIGLPHTQRILINDFAPTNPFPSAKAINIKRNSNILTELI